MAAGLGGSCAVAGANAQSQGPDRGPVFDVRAFGAAGDGIRPDTAAIQAAIDACAQKGGGTVQLGMGRFLSGTIRLRSRVTLRLGEGSVLLGSTRLEDYPATVSNYRSYTDNYTDKSLIYGEDLESVAITGRGSIDGQGASFSGPYKVRPYMLRMIRCRDVSVRDLTFRDSPMWVQHYLACDDVHIHGIRVRSLVNQNNDGIDIDGCHRVRISECDIVSGDDAIVLKSTSERSCRDVVVSDCILSSRCNALKLGTETNGGFENIVLRGCSIYDTRLSGIAIECVDGGTLAQVLVSDIVMRNVDCPIFVRLGNRARPFLEGGKVPGIGTLRGVRIRSVQATGAGLTGCAIAGIPGHPVQEIGISDVEISCAGGGTLEQARRPIPEEESKYPEYRMFGILPAYGFYCRHAQGLTLRNLSLRTHAADARPAIVCDDVEDLELTGMKSWPAAKASPTAVLSNVRDAWICGNRVLAGADAFLLLEGPRTSRIRVGDNETSRVKQPVQIGAGVPPGALLLPAQRQAPRP